MPNDLPPEVNRALQAFRDLGAVGELAHVPHNKDLADERLQQLTKSSEALARTQMLEADGRPTLVIVAGSRTPDLTSLAGVLGVGHVTTVPDHVAHNWTRQEPQAIAPVGHPTNMPVVIDVELSRHPSVWVPAGHPEYLIATSYAELLRITAGTAAEIIDTR